MLNSGTNRNFKKFSKKYKVVHLGQSNSTVTNVNAHGKQTWLTVEQDIRVMVDTRLNNNLECALLTNKTSCRAELYTEEPGQQEKGK